MILDNGEPIGTVTPNGGKVERPEAGFQITFPPQAVIDEVTLNYTEVEWTYDPSAPERKGLRRFILEAVAADGSVYDQFEQSYEMQHRYSDEELAAAGLLEETLQCQWLDETTNEWKPVTSSVDTANNILTCQADHFTEFAVIGDTLQPTTPANQIFLPLVTR